MDTETTRWSDKQVSVTSILGAIHQRVPSKEERDNDLLKDFHQSTHDIINSSDKTRTDHKMRKFCDSDNILLSVYDLEQQRKREKGTKFQDVNKTVNTRNTSDSTSYRNNAEKISITVPCGEKGNSTSSSAGSKTSVTRLQLTHRSRQESLRNIANSAKIAALIDGIPSEDTIDIVVAANDPAQQYRNKRTTSPPEIKISSAGPTHCVKSCKIKEEVGESKAGMNRPYSTFPSFPRSTSKDSVNYDVISEPTTPNTEKEITTSLFLRTHSRESERRRSKSKISFYYSVDPDINKTAYDKALFNARNKYFKHVALDKILTKPFEFSYFTLLDRGRSADAVREKRFKKPYGMKRIFGEIKPDDYYPANKSRSENL